MADYYVYYGATGGATGVDWANAYLTLGAAVAARLAGDRFFVAHDHVENPSTIITITSTGTVANPQIILCVNRLGSVPPVSADLRTTAFISTTSANALTFNGCFYCYGFTFSTNVAASGGGGSINLAAASSNQQRFDNCVFRLLSTAAANLTSGTGTALYLNNCSLKFGNISDVLLMGRCRFSWKNSPSAIDATGSIPTLLFQVTSQPGQFTLEGVDLTAMSSGKTIFANMNGQVDMVLKDCKLTTGVIISAVQAPGVGAGDVQLIRCDPSVNYRMERHNYAGDLTVETSVLRTGGASDGTQSITWKAITTANASWSYPFTCFPISIWNDVVGSVVTATVYATWATGTAVPNKQDIWTDFEYLGSGASPQGSVATSGNANILITSVPCDSDSSTWAGSPSGGGTQTKFKMTATFTPGMKGPITAYVRCARPSTTFYIDPLVVLT